jgi:hypothetical protein
MIVNKLFIENQPYELFNTDKTAILYEERCLPSANAGDIVITSCPIDKEYIVYLKEIGLNLKCEFFSPHVLDRDLASSILNDKKLLKLLKDRTLKSNYVIETFIANRKQIQLSLYLNTPLSFNQDIYDKYSTKLGFIKLAKYLKLPIPDSVIISCEKLDECNMFFEKNKDVLLKKNNSIGGLGVYKASSEAFLKKIMQLCPSEYFILEKKIDTLWNGSIQIIFSNDNYRIFIDECITDNNSFRGFKYPPSFSADILFKAKEYADKIAIYLKPYCEGESYCGIDFIIDRNDKIFFHDCNPRKTGIMYVFAFIKKLIGSVDINNLKIISTFINLRPDYRKGKINFSLIKNLLNKNELLFTQLGRLEGILIFNPSLLAINMLHVISLSNNNCEVLYLNKVKKLLFDII